MKSRGYTLIEVIAAMAIVLVLLALLLPAVQAARESSRRIYCTNNLRQLGLAINLYNTEYGCFPPSTLTSSLSSRPGSSAIASSCYSPFVRLLNSLDEANLFNSVNFSFVPDSSSGLVTNSTAMVTHISFLCCPSDQSAFVTGYGRSNYRYNIGTTPFLVSSNPILDKTFSNEFSGAFEAGASLSPADFRDGLSRTSAISERTRGDWNKGSVRFGGDYQLGNIGYQTLNANGALAACKAINSNPNHIFESRGGESWFISGLHFTAYNQCAPPNHFDTDCSFVNSVGSVHDRHMVDGVFSASSSHAQGVNVLFMEGSVRFIKDTVSLSLWRSIATRSGGDLADID